MELSKLLQTLSEISGVSGRENRAEESVMNLLRPYCSEVSVINGNIIGSVGKRKAEQPHILLDAHLDQVGMIVTYITKEGFIKVGNIGGIDCRLLPAQNVILHGKSDIPGVVCSIPPHLSNGDKSAPKIDEILIDTGYSKEELEEIVQLGDTVSFDTKFQILKNDFVSGRSMDDRCGIASILYSLYLLQNEKLNCSISVLFSTQEEVGERGAKIAAYDINPDIAIAVDVSFGIAHGDDPVKCKLLGSGPMIGISPSLSSQVSNDLIRAAERIGAGWQAEVMSGTTGTNADQFSVTRNGVLTGTISIPLRYMHTPAEIISLKDVRATGEIIASYIRGI